MKYLPFLDGKYSVAPGLLPLKKVENEHDRKVFQIDDLYGKYLQNKDACRRENIRKYYDEQDLPAATAIAVNKFVATQLTAEYTQHFQLRQQTGQYTFINNITGERLHWKEDWLRVEGGKYLSLFDALAAQVQEDFAICQLAGETNRMSAIHVCSANHWAPAEKTGKPFNAIHAIVPGMEKTMPHHFKMLLSVVHKGPYTRFAWGIATDDRLNHHPVPPPGTDPIFWHGRRIEPGCDLYVRVEKQSLTGLPEVDAFFFTIRTYFYHVDTLDQNERAALLAAVETMSPEALTYKGMEGKVEILEQMLAANATGKKKAGSEEPA